jgi:hypothetical protein
MSYKITDRIWKDSESKGISRLVLLALAKFANDDGIAWPSQETLRDLSRCSLRSVRDAIRSLVESGELEIVEQGGAIPGKGHSSTVYRVRVITEAESASVPGRICGSPRQNLPQSPAENDTTGRQNLPPNLSGESVSEYIIDKAGAVSKIKSRLCKMFRRSIAVKWSGVELGLLDDAIGSGLSDPDWDSLATYYAAKIPSEKDFRRRTLRSFLENITGELDRANRFRREQKAFIP